MNKEFENKFRKMCWNFHIDSESLKDSRYYREFAEEFYKLGLEHGKF